MFNGLKSAFGAVKEEVAARGGLLGCADYHAQRFCTLVGKHPAIESVRDLIGDIAQTVSLVSGPSTPQFAPAFAAAPVLNR